MISTILGPGLDGGADRSRGDATGQQRCSSAFLHVGPLGLRALHGVEHRVGREKLRVRGDLLAVG